MKTRLATLPEDYERLGLRQDTVEVWEDGRRNDSHPGAFEWWYLDVIFEDGAKAAFTYATKSSEKFNLDVDSPYVKVAMTLADGTEIVDRQNIDPAVCTWGTEKCDVHMGPHSFVGDLKTYDIHYEAAAPNNIGFDLKVTNTGSPWRPGTGYFLLGDNEEKFFTWLCVCPKAVFEGTMTLNGEVRKVSGSAYHDHQWGTQHMLFTWNHWVWARQTVGEYSILVFDYTGNMLYGYDRYHLAFIQDAEGRTIFENFGDAKVEVLESYVDPKVNKTVPGSFRFTYDNGGKKVVYTIRETAQLEVRDEYHILPKPMQEQFDKMLLQPSYSRLSGVGTLEITENGTTVTETGDDLIYELAYLSREWMQ